jgi:hypothetical protein
MAFTKLDHGIIHSSIWSEPLPTRVLWITMLAMKDDSGFVASSRSGLIRAANITPDEFDKAIKCLESPDEESRTRDYDGRRVEKVEGGWVILNHEKYRLHEDLKKEKHREYMRKWRDKKDSVNNCEFTSDHVNLTSVSVSESESESEKKGDCKGKEKDKPQRNIIPPELEWVVQYCNERKNAVIPQKFFDHYSARGWMIGKNKMKDWQAAVRTWEQSGYNNPTSSQISKKTAYELSHPEVVL